MQQFNMESGQTLKTPPIGETGLAQHQLRCNSLRSTQTVFGLAYKNRFYQTEAAAIGSPHYGPIKWQKHTYIP